VTALTVIEHKVDVLIDAVFRLLPVLETLGLGGECFGNVDFAFHLMAPWIWNDEYDLSVLCGNFGRLARPAARMDSKYKYIW
jgi:hypothetical protein